MCIWLLYFVSFLGRSHLKFIKKFLLCFCGFTFYLDISNASGIYFGVKRETGPTLFFPDGYLAAQVWMGSWTIDHPHFCSPEYHFAPKLLPYQNMHFFILTFTSRLCFTNNLLFPQHARLCGVNCQNTLYRITLTNPVNSNGTNVGTPGATLWRHTALNCSTSLLKVFKLMSLSEMY